MISKRKIVAIVLFILMGFIMFTFANPSDGIESLTKPIEDEPIVEPVDDEKENVIPVNPVVVVDNAPVITVTPATVKIVEGTEYDVKTGVSATDDKDTNLVINASITSVEEVGRYEVTYTVTDSANNTATARRTVIILNSDDDEDNDGYTNKEELDHESNFDDAEEVPEDLEPVVVLTPEEVTIEFGESYDLTSVIEVTDDFDSLEKGITVVISKKNEEVSSLKVDKYTITYTVTDRAGNEVIVTRTLNVVDTTAPTITLNGENNITLEAGVDTYTELNATATDLVDGTWTVEPEFIHYSIGKDFIGTVDAVDTTKAGTYKVQFSCKDRAGNVCVDENNVNHPYVIRVVNVVDTTAPTITLNGENNITLEAGVDTYTKLNATATDLVDGTWTVEPEFIHYSIGDKFIGTVDAVDTTKVGTYKVVYSCKDTAGNACVDENNVKHAYVIRFVNVVDTIAPVITGVENNAFYNHDITFEVTDKTSYTVSVDNELVTDYTVSTEGKHTITVVDAGNNTTTLTFTIDKTNPWVEVKTGANETIGSIADKVYSKLSLKLRDNIAFDKFYINGVLAGDVTNNTYGDANGLTVKSPGAKEGLNTFTLVDAAGNSYDYEFTFDTTAPRIEVKTGANETIGTIADKIYSKLSLKLIDNTKIDKYYLNGVLVQDATNNSYGDANYISINTKGAKEGLNTFTLVDIAGNSTDYVFTLDVTAPTIKVKTGANETIGSIADKVYTKLSLKLGDNVAIDKYYLNGVLNNDVVNAKGGDANFIKVTSRGAKSGLNTFTLVDAAGNTTDYVFTFDTVAPKIDIKKESVRVEGLEDTYTNVSFKLSDDFKADKIVINGYTKDFANNKWSDLNGVAVGKAHGVLGANYVTLYDVAGNTTTYNFTLKKNLTEADLKDVVFNDGTFNYDGLAHSIYVTNLPEWASVEYVNNGLVDMQVATVTAKITAKLDSDFTGTVELTATLTINDTEAPLISLNGEEVITLERGIDEYVEYGATVTDNVDPTNTNFGPIAINYFKNPNNTANGVLVKKVDNNVVGRYNVVYIYKDSSKNQALDKNNLKNDFVRRIVYVVDTTKPVITGIENGATYEEDKTFGVSEEVKTYIIDGVEYTEETVNKTLTGEGTHTVKVVDLYGNESDEVTITIDYSFTITQQLSEELINQGYRIAGGNQTPVVNKYFDEIKFSSFACVNDGTNYSCKPVVWKDSKGNIVSVIKDEKAVVSSYDMTYEEDETFTAYQMGAIIEYRLSDEFIEMGAKIGSHSTNSNIGSFTTVRTYYYNEATRLTSFPYVNSGNGTYEVYNSNNELVSRIDEKGLTKPIRYDHVVTGHEVYTIRPVTYTVVFKDYNGEELSSTSVIYNTDTTSIAPNMDGKTYTANKVTYTFTGWDKELGLITSNTTYTAQYAVSKVVANVFVLKDGVVRPAKGGTAPNGVNAYTKLTEIELTLTDDVKKITNNNSAAVLTYDLTKVLEYFDETLLPVPTDREENFTKYEWYTVKHEADGWHVDGEVVLDEAYRTTVRNNAIQAIKDYATSKGFNADAEDITSIINVSDINNKTTKTTIDEAVNTAKASIDTLLEAIKKDAKIAVANANDGFNESYQANADAIVAAANTNIDNASTKDIIETTRDNAIAELNNLKALMNQTFVVSLTENKNNVLISEIASDVTINNVTYRYKVYGDENIELTNNGSSSFVTNKPLDEVYRDVNEVVINYTKNNKSYNALYKVNYEWRTEIVNEITLYMEFPESITEISNEYKD